MNIVVLVNKPSKSDNEWVNPLAFFFSKNIFPGVSSFDKYAIEAGVSLKERLGDGNVTALTVGPLGRQQLLREAISMGCDNAILVYDSGETDIGKTLSKAIKKLGNINLVLCGSGMSEDIIGYIGKEVSEYLNVSRVDSVLRIEDLCGDSITVKRKTGEGYDVIKVPFPAVITVEEDSNTPRVPSARDKIKARRKTIPVWQVKELHPVENTLTDDKCTHKSEQYFSSVYREEVLVAAEEKDIFPYAAAACHDQSVGEGPDDWSDEKKRIDENDGEVESQVQFPGESKKEVLERSELEDIIEEDLPQSCDENVKNTDTNPKDGEKPDFLGYWALKEKPFENTGSVRYFYYSPTHKEALVRLIYVIKQNKAGALLAGGYGTGKTTIAKELLTELELNDRYKSVYISNPMVNSTELLQEIAYQLKCDSENESRLILRRNIAGKLEDIAKKDNHTVILVDEAHLISRKEVLEELRLFMNLQYKEKFLTSIILMGQLVLRDIINSMPQFKQRFAMYYILKQLNEDETQKYIKHRLKVAGTEKEIFTPEAFSLIYLSSEGRPRQINNICDMALLIGHMRNISVVDEEMIREVVKDLGQEL